MVVKQALEPELEGHFHPDSYGYRPGALPIDRKLALWATRTFKRLRRHRRRAEPRLRNIARGQPGLFAHWRLIHKAAG